MVIGSNPVECIYKYLSKKPLRDTLKNILDTIRLFVVVILDCRPNTKNNLLIINQKLLTNGY